ncbi:MAG TPA: hypothetical protein VHZ24_07620 [Pirellulales bacterium]|jgi:hypothetical protein|nr:hypothetical protein [Pirellulales bacterium]
MLNKIDVYTVMLGLALMAILIAVLLLTMELGRFPTTKPIVATPGSMAPTEYLSLRV